MRHIGTCLIVLALAGCINAGDSEVPSSPFYPFSGTCEPLYSPECQGNPDPILVKEAMGIQQFTNKSWTHHPVAGIKLRGMDQGTVMWVEGGAGYRVEFHVADLGENERRSLHPGEHLGGPRATGGPIFQDGLVFFYSSPITFENEERIVHIQERTFFTWDVLQNVTRQIEVPVDGETITRSPGGFDGTWGIVERPAWREKTAEISVVNVATGEEIMLAERRPRLNEVWQPAGSMVTEGKVYMPWSLRGDNEPDTVRWRLEEIDLETGSRHMVWEGEPGVLLSYWQVGGGHVAISVRGEEHWFRYLDGDEWRDVFPEGYLEARTLSISGDWAVGNGFVPGGPPSTIAVHLPTGAWHVVVEHPSWFRATDVATDGEYIVIQAYLRDHSRQMPIEYPLQTNLYWTRLHREA